MFDDLDATLRAVLADAAAPADVRTAEVSFDTPDRDFKPDPGHGRTCSCTR